MEEEQFRVLLVDDNDLFRVNVREALAYIGLSIREARSGGEALQLLHDEPFDLILSDIRMEEIDGIHLLERIRAKGGGIPILLMSAYPFTSLLDRAKKAGFTCFLPKPFSLEELSAAVVAGLSDGIGSPGALHRWNGLSRPPRA